MAIATRYYGKEIPESPVYVNGVPLRFEALATEDDSIIRELDNCIAGQRGGITAITKEQYEEAQKKKPNGISSESVFKQQRRRQELSALELHGQGVAGAGDVRSGGMFARPQTPHNQGGLPTRAAGPSDNKPTPDPIEVPDRAKIAAARPSTAKLGAVNGDAKKEGP